MMNDVLEALQDFFDFCNEDFNKYSNLETLEFVVDKYDRIILDGNEFEIKQIKKLITNFFEQIKQLKQFDPISNEKTINDLVFIRRLKADEGNAKGLWKGEEIELMKNNHLQNTIKFLRNLGWDEKVEELEEEVQNRINELSK
jgi:hypothetical protein